MAREFGELFAEQSWVAVMLGQGVEPGAYHPFVDQLEQQQLTEFMTRVRASIAAIVDRQPTHEDYLATLANAPGQV